MKTLLLLGATLASAPCLTLAASVKAPDPIPSDQNSSLSFNYDDPNSFSIRYPRTIDWMVDGERILVYPSSPTIHLNVGHIHPDSHVASNQIHAQGPYLKDAKDWGPVSQGVVYTVEGGAPGSHTSRLVEKVDVFNKTNAPLSIQIVGMGWTPQPAVQPNQAALEIPDFRGVTGTTVAFIQGNGYKDPQGAAHAGPITDLPPSGYSRIPDNVSATFGSVTVLPPVSFAEFNTVNQVVDLPAGATLTVITELNVKR